MRVATFTLRIEGPDDGTLAAGINPNTMSEILDIAETHDESVQDAFVRWLGGNMTHAEDAVNDRLPDGYYCKIDQGSEGVDLDAVARLEEMGR